MATKAPSTEIVHLPESDAPVTAYLTDGRHLVEVRSIDEDGMVRVHNCMDRDESTTFFLDAASLAARWKLVENAA